MDIIDLSVTESDENEESPAKTQIEARFIAQRISGLINGAYMIPDGKGGARRVMYSDIAILLRSVSGKAWQYAGALSEYGIPADIPGSEGYFDTIEISAALSLLTIIDNPMQDIPLVATLRGPVYGLSADELAEIRIQSGGTDFYSALVKAAEKNEKCATFLRDINSLRVRVPDMPSDRFIWYMYNKTGLLGLVGAMRGGVRRRANLILLVEYARRIENSGYKGLFGFLSFIHSLQDKDAEIAGSQAVLSQNSVRIMSIHKSKGLEFPIVFLADTSKQFNYTDMQQPLVLHTALGIGLKRIDRQRRIEYPTIARMAIQSKLKAEMLAEELRVLYVAMTRAREKLIVTAAVKQGVLDKMQGTRDSIPGIRNSGAINKIAPQILEDIKSMSGWILAAIGPEALRSAQQCGKQNAECKYENPELFGTNCLIRIIPASDLTGRDNENPDFEPRISHSPGATPYELAAPCGDDILNSYVEQLNEQFSFVYPYGSAPDLPSKITVTELKGRQIDYDSAVEAMKAGYAKSQETGDRRFAFEKPGFITEKTGLTAAQRGTALHQVMQYIDFSMCIDAIGVDSELRRLADKGFITDQQADAVDAQKITRFFESDVGKRVLKANNIKREFKFSLLSPAGDFFPGGGDDKIMLQGIVDCFFEEDGELTVVDFKTDNVTADTLERKASDYTPQLIAYSNALERITRKRVKERIIYFFALNIACEV